MDEHGSFRMTKRIVGALLVVFMIQLMFISRAVIATRAGKSLNIALLTWRGETEGEQGFRETLQALGYSVAYTVYNPRQDKTELGRILRQKIIPKLEEFDYIYTFGTTVSKATKTLIQNKIPQIYNFVSSPVKAGIIQGRESSGGNISGVTIRVPLDIQIQAALKIMKFKKIGFFFNSREKNSLIERERFYELAKKMKFEVVDLRSPPALDTLERNLQKLVDKSVVVDVVYFTNDSWLVSKAGLIGSQLRVANMRSIGTNKPYIDKGILMGVVWDYHAMGKAAANIIDRHQKGEKLQTIPVQTPPEPILMINKTTMERLGVDIPEEILKKARIVE